MSNPVKHILFIHQFATTPYEAGEIRHVELFKLLAAQGIKTTIVGGSVHYQSGGHFKDFRGWVQDKSKDCDCPALTFYRIHALPYYRKGFLGRMLTYLSFMLHAVFFALKLKDCDLVLATSPSLFTGLAGYIIAQLKARPFYFEMRDLWPRAAVEMGLLKNPWVIKLAYKLEKWLCRKAVKNIVITPGYADYIRSLGIPATNIAIVENGVDEWMTGYNLDSHPVPAVLEPFAGKFIIMHIGAIGPFNYLDRMLKVAEALKTNADISFVIVGDGKERAPLEQSVRELHLDNFHFTGAVTRKEIADYLACAHLGFSIYPQTPIGKLLLQNKVLDYMAMAKPVLLVAEEGDTSRIITQSGAGFRIDYSLEAIQAQILWCWQHQEQLPAMGQKGRDYVKQNLLRPVLARKFLACLTE